MGESEVVFQENPGEFPGKRLRVTLPGLKEKQTQFSLEKQLLGVLLIQRNPFGSKSIWIGKREELRLGGGNLMESSSSKGDGKPMQKGSRNFSKE